MAAASSLLPKYLLLSSSCFFFILSSSLLLSCSSSTALPPTAVVDQFLKAHNQARAAVGVGPLSWIPSLAANASLTARFQRDKRACGFAELSSSGEYGANQGWASYPASPAEVVDSWVGEGKYYNHANNTCAAGHQCGTYTQVVWRKSLQLGCAQVRCSLKRDDDGSTLTICFYYPHGNVQGQTPY